LIRQKHHELQPIKKGILIAGETSI
jgi:hypothetical protein